MNLQANNNSTVVQSVPDFLNDFFQDLKSCYPSWGAQLKTPLAEKKFKQQWIKAFSENGINTPEKLECGLMQARKDKSSWLPACGQFVDWCTPSAESLGLPDVRTAYREAVFHKADDEWSCALVYFSQLSIKFELRTLSENRSFKLFEVMYAAVLKRILNGEVLSAPPKPLPAPDQVAYKGDPEKIQGLIDGIFADMGWVRS